MASGNNARIADIFIHYASTVDSIQAKASILQMVWGDQMTVFEREACKWWNPEGTPKANNDSNNGKIVLKAWEKMRIALES